MFIRWFLSAIAKLGLGYLNGAAVVIVISQWGKLFGIELEQENLFLRLLEWWQKVPTTNLTTLAVALAFLALPVLSKMIIRKLPPLVPVFFIALAACVFIDFEAMGLDVIGEIRNQTPHAVVAPRSPTWPPPLSWCCS